MGIGAAHLPLTLETGDSPRTDVHDDVRIVELAKLDPRAFAPLYERYAEPIYFFCYRRLGNAEAASDAAATVFLRAISAIDTFQPRASKPGSTVRAWLYIIARNVVTDHYRSARHHTSLDHPDAPVVPDRATSPEEHAIGAEESRLVNALLLRLPDRQRAVAELRLAGLSITEIANALGLSVSATKSLQVRAYRALRDLLQSDPSAVSREIPQ